MHERLSWLVFGALAAASWCARVEAQPAPAVDRAKAKTAKQYVDAGLAAQANADFETAITFYQKAYDLVPHPTLLFNIAQAHRLAGQAAKAVEFYQGYLAADPNGAQAQSARDFITELKPKADEERAAEQAQAAQAAEAAKRDEQARKDREAATALAAAKKAQVDASAAPAPNDTDHGATLRLVGLGAGGAGVVSLGVGIAFGLRARSISNDLSQPGAMYSPSRVDQGHTANTIAVVGIAAGSALLIAGGIMYWRGRAADHVDDHVAVAPFIGGGQVGLALGGTLP